MVETDVKGKWRICVATSFAAAHALRHYEGKCERIHGHNFEVQACVEGVKLQEKTEILLDFKILRQILAEVLNPFDHRLLNEVPPFDAINPSSENLAQHIAIQLADILAARVNPALKVSMVAVSEKQGQSASWLSED